MKKVSQNPSVAIRCLVYNHEKYLRDCLDGIVMQKTNFPFFAVVHDDCSKDSSSDIIREYQRNYPDLIRPIFEEENCYSTDWHLADIKIHEAYGDAKYIAVCEGDDYWTDPYKLQKQVDYLEAHSDYAVCAHETIIKDEQNSQKNAFFSLEACKNRIIPSPRTDYSFEDTLKGNIFHLSSILFRHEDLTEFPRWRYKISAGDMIFFRYLGSCGKTHWIPEAMSVYRGHHGSLTTEGAEYQSLLPFLKMNILVLRLLNRFWQRQYQDKVYPIISRYYVECAMNYLRKSQRNVKEFRRMAKVACCYHRSTALKYLAKGLANKVISHL